MADWPQHHIIEPVNTGNTSMDGGDNFTGGALCRMVVSNLASTIWPVASQALYLPFQTHNIQTIYQLSWMNGATVSGNVDAGIYDINLNRLTSVGGVAQSGVSTVQVSTVTNVTIQPGNYYYGFVLNNITGTISMSAVNNLVLEGIGAATQTSAYPLPATATFSPVASTGMPLVSVHFVATV